MLISTYVVKLPFVRLSSRERKNETPHLSQLRGNCKEAFQFYQQHLGGKITMMMTHGEQPAASEVAPNWKDAILYARMTIGETEIMANDVPPERFQPMRSVYLSLS